MQRLPRNLHLVATWRSPDNAIRKKTQHDTSTVLRLPSKMTMDTSKVLRLPPKLQRIFWKRRACHTKRVSTRYETRLNVTKCHAYDAKRINATCATSKSDPFWRTYHRHGHTGLARTVANGCGRLRTVGQRRANTPSTPRPPDWNGNPCYALGKKGRNGTKKADVRHRRPVPSLSGKMFLLACRFRKQR